MKAQVLEANRRLATALGWTNIIDAGGALMGSPPWAIPHARGQMLVPNWAGDWRECGPLSGKYDVGFGYTSLDAVATARQYDKGAAFEAKVDHQSNDAAARLAIVRAVINALEAGK